jgi:hypothetical protein
MTRSRRSLCGAADIKGWSARLVPEQIRAQQALVEVMLTACREAGLPEEIVQSSGDGVLILPPSDIDESRVIPGLVHGLRVALHQENRLLSDPAKVRLRFALTSGMVTPGPAGFSGTAVVECFRLLDSPPVKTLLVDYPHAELAVIVSDYLFHDVIRNGFRDLAADDFWPVHSSLPEKRFSANAWVWVSDRRDGPPPPARTQPAPAHPAEPDDLAAARKLLTVGQTQDALRLLARITPDGPAARQTYLDLRADALLQAGRDDEARQDLEELLGLQPDPAVPPGPSALLRLGRCHARLGADQAARHTWTFLLEHQPTMAEAYLELGRLERRAGRHATAQGYLLEGVRLIRGERTDRFLDDFIQELAALPAADRAPARESDESPAANPY